MELKQLRSFAAVVQCGSFTKASEKLYLSQPTISAHVQKLEEELGKRLILRTNSAVFPGVQGGPLEHVIAAKAVAFGECLSDEYLAYVKQVKANAQAMCQAFISKGYKVISGGTDNHLMLIDLRTKFPELTGKVAENTLVKADITINKNMVPFDSRTPFTTSGIRVGTPAVTTRGLKEADMPVIVDLIDQVLSDVENEQVLAKVRKTVNEMMSPRPLYAW